MTKAELRAKIRALEVENEWLLEHVDLSLYVAPIASLNHCYRRLLGRPSTTREAVTFIRTIWE